MNTPARMYVQYLQLPIQVNARITALTAVHPAVHISTYTNIDIAFVTAV